MKVIFPVVDKDTNKYTIAGGFNETDCLCVYDTQDNNLVWFEKKAIDLDEQQLLPVLIRNNMMHIVTKGVKPMALNVLSHCGFTVYKSMGDDLLLNIELYNKECLPFFNLDSSFADSKACGAGCASCSSSTCKN